MKSVERQTVPPFNEYEANLFSQNGEDGVIAEILTRLELLGLKNSWCVEFGAWDGVYLSNTFSLVKNHGFNAVYIEGDQDRYLDLIETAALHPSIIPINAFVSSIEESDDCLDKILATTAVPREFTVLSIDVDSNDLELWESSKEYCPILVVIEINSSVPPGVYWRHSKFSPGNTFSAVCDVANQKGYTLLCHTGNLIFVKNEYVHLVGLGEKYLQSPELLFMFREEWMNSNPFVPRKYSEVLARNLKSSFIGKISALTPGFIKKYIRGFRGSYK